MFYHISYFLSFMTFAGLNWNLGQLKQRKRGWLYLSNLTYSSSGRRGLLPNHFHPLVLLIYKQKLLLVWSFYLDPFYSSFLIYGKFDNGVMIFLFSPCLHTGYFKYPCRSPWNTLPFLVLITFTFSTLDLHPRLCHYPDPLYLKNHIPEYHSLWL